MINKILEVIFANKKLEKSFLDIDEDDEVKKGIKKAIKQLKENPLAGIQIPKKLIPYEYVKEYGIKNLWKYDLPNGWRLIYSITTPSKIEIISVIIEWFNHKNYERKFKYLF